MRRTATVHPGIADRQRVRAIIAALKRLFPHLAQPLGKKRSGTILQYSNDWELLVAVELSAQCTDVQVNRVTEKLFKKYRTLDDYVRAKPGEFERDIYATGFYKNKTKNILAAAKAVKQKFRGRIPKTMEEMLVIPGVGRKTANVVLGNVHGIVEGIAVDTHVRRLSRLLGFTVENNPDKIERDLMAVVPKKEWFRFTYLLIEYGRTYCVARPHDHKQCPLFSYSRE